MRSNLNIRQLMIGSRRVAQRATEPFETGNLQYSIIARRTKDGFSLTYPGHSAGYGYFLDKGHNIVVKGQIVGRNEKYKGWSNNVRMAVAMYVDSHLKHKPNPRKFVLYDKPFVSDQRRRDQQRAWEKKWQDLKFRGVI